MTATRVAILGASGSIGRQALDVVAAHPDRLRVTRSGRRGDDLVALATADDVDVVLVATPGIAGLGPTIAALRAGKRVALANKEVLVVGGHLVRALSGGAGDRLRPVDSEHCALWQCLSGVDPDDVARVTLTASGGPFREAPLSEMSSVTPERALRHPTWKMGPKVTVDSATLVNKAYEVIETHWLYGLPYDRIDVVVHPESVVHALVELVDGSVIAQLAEPDMRLPIQYALLWDRAPSPAPRLDLSRARQLTFRGAPAPERYPCFETVLRAARGGDPRAVVGASAADEIAVERFLDGDVPFDGIVGLLREGIEAALRTPPRPEPSLVDIEAIDSAVRGALAAAPTAARS
ncbi:MAG: 1-deoxy-D-xylulose-5-phosphate reductoisomerase [Chloroflexota bacterium]|nr:1-deoxy-D-xylulose-5-phosphate reductoisomerase [Chloroflexota bacterium]MDE3192711.1 1-deoxy-D-xylulose-5-phosphate reductoisomerase [Chloroflexota bacterium]